MNFNIRLDNVLNQLICENLNKGIVYIPTYDNSSNQILLYKANITKIIHRYGDKWVAKDFGSNEKLPGKFYGFAATNIVEEYPDIVSFDLVAIGEKLSNFIVDEITDSGFKGVYTIDDRMKNKDSIIQDIEAIDRLDIYEIEEINFAIGLGYLYGEGSQPIERQEASGNFNIDNYPGGEDEED